MALTGTHFVKHLKSAMQEAKRLWPHAKHFFEVHRHALKLRNWGVRHINENAGSVLDLNYESIKALPGEGIYELRVDDEIGGRSNIRINFLVTDSSWKPRNWVPPMPVIWLLATLQKKRQEWTAENIKAFKAKKALVKVRFYS